MNNIFLIATAIMRLRDDAKIMRSDCFTCSPLLEPIVYGSELTDMCLAYEKYKACFLNSCLNVNTRSDIYNAYLDGAVQCSVKDGTSRLTYSVMLLMTSALFKMFL